MSEPEPPAQVARPALRLLRFVAQLDPGVTPLVEFRDPYPRWAVVSSVAVDPLPAAPQRAGDESFVLFIPPALETEWAAKAQVWLQGTPDCAAPVVRAPLEEGWLVWRPGQAVVVCPEDQLEAYLNLLARFFFYELELRRLEEELAADWHHAEADLSLAHEVTAKDLERQAQLGRMTERTLSRRMRHVRIEPRFDQLPVGLPPAQRKVARTLLRRARIADRLEFLDGQLETYEYIYELANQRMGEYTLFRREYLVEWLIVIVLALEVVFVIADMFLNYYMQ